MADLASMQRYESYKDSGVDWLGDIPSGWNLLPLKYKLKFHTGGTPSSGSASFYNGDLPWVTISDLDGRQTRKTHYLSKAGVRAANIPLSPKNSLLYSFKLSIGQVAFSHVDLYTNEAIASFIPDDGINLNYYFYALPTFLEHNAEVNIYGAKLLNQSRISNAAILDISEAEQTAIANFLDKKTLQIDEAIAIKEKQIELLKERKQILIQESVTKGLDIKVSLKNTELSWAPQVASHWSLLPNRVFLKMRRVPVGLAHEKYQLLSLTKRGVLVRDLSKGAGKQSDFLERMQEVREGDLIFCLFDVEETPRTVGFSEHLGMISADYTIFECIDEPTGRFLEYFYKSMDDQKSLKPLYKGLRKRIPKPKFLRTNCPMPPKDELLKIIQFLDQVEVDTTNSIEIILSQIEKLKEYKATLIYSAVTGKIKVPGGG